MMQSTTVSNDDLQKLIEEVDKIIGVIAVNGSTVTTAEQFIKMTVDLFLKILEVYVGLLDEDQDVVINDELINKIIDCVSVGFRATIIAEDTLLGDQSEEIKKLLSSNVNDERHLINQLNSLLKEKQNGSQESQENKESSGSEGEADQDEENEKG